MEREKKKTTHVCFFPPRLLWEILKFRVKISNRNHLRQGIQSSFSHRESIKVEKKKEQKSWRLDWEKRISHFLHNIFFFFFFSFNLASTQDFVVRLSHFFFFFILRRRRICSDFAKRENFATKKKKFKWKKPKLFDFLEFYEIR